MPAKTIEQCLSYLQAQLSVYSQSPDYAFGFVSLFSYQYPESDLAKWFHKELCIDQGFLDRLNIYLETVSIQSKLKG